MGIFLEEDQVSGKVLDHLGLVATTIEALGLVKKIDDRISVSAQKGAKTTIGQRVSAMILNGLGFIDDRLYMFPEFLKNKPVDRLLGEGLCAKDFNDDTLGRALDKIHEYGETKLFSELAFEIGVEQDLLGKSAHIDSSSLSVTGEYVEQVPVCLEEPLIQKERVLPKHGHSKDHRADLKQMVINLATTGQAGFPIWMEAHSGNASDKKILYEAAQKMQSFCKQIKQAPDFLYVADSAMYDSCLKGGGEIKWLSRIPEQHKVAKKLLQHHDDELSWTPLDNDYKICMVQTRYQGVHQRWCIVHSEPAYKRESITLEKRIISVKEEQDKALWHLGNQMFACEADAKKAAQLFEKSLKYHTIEWTIHSVIKHKGKGRPAKDSVPETRGYQVLGELRRDEQRIELIRRQKGRFILATNELDPEILPDTTLLKEYKEQSKTEKGFRFLKDDTFEVSSIFLKKPERIAALMMVMTLCLMVYGFAEYTLRKSLLAAQDTLPNQINKPTQQPTMKWIYRLFHGVSLIRIQIEQDTQEIVINLTPTLRKIIRYFGHHALKIYGMPPE
jgi:transposase